METTRKHKLCRNTLAIAVAAISFTQANPSLAQNLVLEEVIVTAQKRVQSLQDVPLTVSAVSAETIQNAGINTIEDVKYLVPALNIYSATSPALTSISIRGAGTGASDPTLEPSVGVFIDGVFMPRSIFGMSELVDVERVEVLMGPQGTLYGKNTNAGVISVTTKGAPEEFEAQIEASAGDYDLMEGKVSLGGVMTDTLAWRLGGLYRQRDGLIEDEITGDDDYNEIDRYALRGQLFWDPADSLSVRTIGYYSNSDANQGSSENVFVQESALYQYFAGVQSAFGLPAPKLKGDDYKVQGPEPDRSEVEVKGGSVQIDYSFANEITLTSISAYQDWSQDDRLNFPAGVALEVLRTEWPIEEQSFSQELRLTSPGGETVDWLAGLYYFDSELKLGSKKQTAFNYTTGLPGIEIPWDAFGIPLPGTIPLIAPNDNANWYNKNETESWSAFGQATWNISDQTSLTMGLRYDDESKDFEMLVAGFDAAGVPWSVENYLSGAYTGGFFVPFTSGNLVDGGPTVRSSDRDEDNWSGMISLNHFIGDAMLYATIATGNKSGGFNGSFGAASIEDREFDTEESINYEIGAKIDGLLDGRMRLNVAYFYTEFDDFQAATFDPVTVQNLVKNAGQQTTQGIDLGTTILVTDKLTLTANLQYLDAEYDDFKNANCHPLSGEKIVNGGCVLDGEEMEFAADWSGSLSADYIQPLDGGSEVYGRLGFSFKSDHVADPTRAPYARDINYELWDGRIGWRNDHWDISLWGKNLTDETYTLIDTANFFGTTFNILTGDVASTLNHRPWVNEPRTWGATLRYTY